MGTTYLVGIGGQSRDAYTAFASLFNAESLCLHMARVMASAQCIDPDDIEVYDNGPDERGACPSNDTGGSWPVIIEVTP